MCVHARDSVIPARTSLEDVIGCLRDRQQINKAKNANSRDAEAKLTIVRCSRVFRQVALWVWAPLMTHTVSMLKKRGKKQFLMSFR